MVRFRNYGDGNEESAEYSIPSKVTEIGFTYDGGRVTVIVNGDIVFSTALGGTDFAVDITSP